jgi:Ca2+-binding EF-hand superfamily protein
MGVALALDSVGSGDPAPRSPQANKVSSRSARPSSKREAKTTSAKKGAAATSAGDELATANASAPERSVNAAQTIGTGHDGRNSSELSMEMRAISKLELSAAALHEIADGFLRTASSKEAARAGTREGLHVVLGALLIEKSDTKGGQAFFRELDVNGDGSVSKIEFKQMMRKLGLLGEGSRFDVKSVEKLFDELDADGGGELDINEITIALKKLRAKVMRVEKDEAVAQAEAAQWRTRAERMRESAEAVGAKESIARELYELKHNPSVEVRLVTLLAKAQLKPQDLLAKFDGDGNGAIDKHEFAKGLKALRIDATQEELHELHGKLDNVS